MINHMYLEVLSSCGSVIGLDVCSEPNHVKFYILYDTFYSMTKLPIDSFKHDLAVILTHIPD